LWKTESPFLENAIKRAQQFDVSLEQQNSLAACVTLKKVGRMGCAAEMNRT